VAAGPQGRRRRWAPRAGPGKLPGVRAPRHPAFNRRRMAALGIALLAVLAAGCTGTTKAAVPRSTTVTTKAAVVRSTTTTTIRAAPTTTTTTAPPATPTTTGPLGIGGSVSLSNGTGGLVSVTLETIVDPDTADHARTFCEGPTHRLVAVQVEVANVGSTIVQATDPQDGVVLVGPNSMEWTTRATIPCGVNATSPSLAESFATPTCMSAPRQVDLSPGASVMACAVFSLPSTDSIAEVQYQSSTGLGWGSAGTVAIWHLASP
jgi:hypothetical protein